MSAEQGTPEWLLERAGHATASRFSDILAKIKTGEAAGRRNYRIQLVTERLTGLAVEGYKNAAMQWGNDTEPQARAAYEEFTGTLVEQVGFVKSLDLDWVGCSPDGIIGPNCAGGVEIKCPFVSTVHVETIIADVVPSEHIAQIQGCMWVTGAKWWDFVSYDPRMPENLQLFVKRVERDDAYINALWKEVDAFLKEVEALTEKLRGRA